MSVYPETASDIPMDTMEKASSQSLYGREYDQSYMYNDNYYQNYGDPHEDLPESEEERALVRKIDLLVMPVVCLIDLLQVGFRYL